MALPVESKNLHVPFLEELSSVLKCGLELNFAQVSVETIDCPDLTKAPYNLSAPGLSGSPRLVDIGGTQYMFPLVNKTKTYDFTQISQAIDLPNAFLIGAGAGPHEHVGVNSEMMSNIVTGNNPKNGSRICKIVDDDYVLQPLTNDQSCCSVVMNLFASEGRSGKVLKIKVKKRTGPENFVSCMRKSLLEKYKENPVGLGGLFRVTSGSIKCHVMPNFSETPLKTDDDVNSWLKFFDMPAPMMFFSVLVSKDPGLDLRVEHSHGYGEKTGGHYHYDVTPDEVEYEAYYNVADVIYRVDRPELSDSLGRM